MMTAIPIRVRGQRTRRRRVAIVGHVVPSPVRLSTTPAQLTPLLKVFNYTRVLTDSGELVDHVAFLKEQLRLRPETPFSVWEMYLCAGLLLKSHLERNGHDVLLINYIDSDNESAAGQRLRDFHPDVVVLSTTFVLTPKHLCEAAQLLRTYVPDTFIVAGGHHVFTTLMYLDEPRKRQFLLESRLDAMVDDVQGEATLLELLAQWPDGLAAVPNLIRKTAANEVIINRREEEHNDVNATLIEFGGIPEGSVIHMRTARSCSFKCAFCSYPTIAGPLATMDLEHAVNTMRRAKDAGVRAVFFVDDTFNVPRPRFEKLVAMIEAAGLNMPWYSFLRGQFVDAKLIRRMRASGCQGVFLGIESGSDLVLKNMDKGSAVKFYRPSIKWLQDEGITTVGAFVVGFPGESAATVAETAEFIETSGLDFYFLQPFYYLHHTPVHNVADRFGLKGKGLNWSHSTMNAREAVQKVDEMFLNIKGPTFVNPDYTLWEVAYLTSKGMDMERIREYRRTINQMTVSQMTVRQMAAVARKP